MVEQQAAAAAKAKIHVTYPACDGIYTGLTSLVCFSGGFVCFSFRFSCLFVVVFYFVFWGLVFVLGCCVCFFGVFFFSFLWD